MDYQELKSKLVEALKEFMDMCDEDDLDFDEELEECIEEAEDKKQSMGSVWEQRIKDFAKLKDGWDSYGGKRISPKIMYFLLHQGMVGYKLNLV